jgi:hypothetical protein
MPGGSAAAQQQSASGGKIAGTAIVVLTPEFCTVEGRKGNAILGPEIFRLGRMLCPSAEEAVGNSFERVIRVESAPKPEDAGGRLILIPHYTDMEATHPMKGKRRMALLLEWSATDPSGNVLWVQTVEGAADAGGANHQKLAEAVMRDLVAKSTKAIQESPEIRQFVERAAGK